MTPTGETNGMKGANGVKRQVGEGGGIEGSGVEGGKMEQVGENGERWEGSKYE